MNKSYGLRTILLGGMIAGALDGTAACIHAGTRGITPTRVFQFVASGALGPASFKAGLATVFLGIFFHFLIATCAMTVYFLLSRKFPWLVRHAVPSGVLYGILVFFFMNNIVVPLSLTQKGPFSLSRLLIGIVIHIFCIGLSIALVTKARSKLPGDAN